MCLVLNLKEVFSFSLSFEMKCVSFTSDVNEMFMMPLSAELTGVVSRIGFLLVVIFILRKPTQ